jgi:hypothetical protein
MSKRSTCSQGGMRITRTTGQSRRKENKEQYRVGSPLCVYVGSFRQALSTTVCVGIHLRCVLVSCRDDVYVFQ